MVHSYIKKFVEFAMGTWTQNAAVLYNSKKFLILCNLFLISLLLPLAKAINRSNQFLANNALFRKWYYNSQGELKHAGDLVQRPEYATVLNMIADEGPEIMYNGSIAKEIVDEVRQVWA